MPNTIATILGLICAIAATIVLYILVLPERKRPTLNKFFQFIHDAFNFKILLLEKILRFLYVLSTCLVIFVGFFLLFARVYGYGFYGPSTFLIGLLTMILGPIIIRITYELMMLVILMVKNLTEINRKMDRLPGVSTGFDETKKSEPNFLFCTQCGTRYDANQGNCPNCGQK